MTPKLVRKINIDHQKKEINQDFRNILGKGKKYLTKYFNFVLPTIKQGYDFVKVQNLLEQKKSSKVFNFLS